MEFKKAIEQERTDRQKNYTVDGCIFSLLFISQPLQKHQVTYNSASYFLGSKNSVPRGLYYADPLSSYLNEK
jgi:hypothetical protein